MHVHSSSSLLEQNRPCFYILETKDDFVQVAVWKAKVIIWLHLEWFFGRVYGADERGVKRIEERVSELGKKMILFQKQTRLSPQSKNQSSGFFQCVLDRIGTEKDREQAYSSLIKLSCWLRCMNDKSSSFSALRQNVQDVANIFFFGRPFSSNLNKIKWWQDQFATLLSYQFLEDIEKETDEKSAQLFKNICVEIEAFCPSGSRDILEPFFKKIHEKKNLFSIQEIKRSFTEKWEKEDLCKKEEIAYFAFSKEKEDFSPADVASWFKEELNKISQLDESYRSVVIHYLISTMRKNLAEWKFRAVLQAYGVFVAQGCKDDIILQFEAVVTNLKNTFSSDENAFVMEGLVERKGTAYCLAIAQRISKLSDPEKGLCDYEENARALFGRASSDLIQAVMRSLLEYQLDPVQFSIDRVIKFFIEKSIADPFVLSPLLGCRINVQKSICPQAIERSLSKTDLKRFQSFKNLWSLTEEPKKESGLEGVETKLVSLLAHDCQFCTFYGELLGKKIIAKARMSKSGSYDAVIQNNVEIYRDVLWERIPLHAERIILKMEGIVKTDLLAETDALLSNYALWTSTKVFSALKVRLEKDSSSLEFCPAAEEIVKNFIESFFSKCIEEKELYSEKPSLSFLYKELSILMEAHSVAILALGLQAKGSEVLYQLLRSHEKAKEILSWFKKAKCYYTDCCEEQFSFSLCKASVDLKQIWAGVTPDEEVLLKKWISFFPDSIAIENSIFRSGASSIMIQKAPLDLKSEPSSRIIGSCIVAESLLNLVPGEKTSNHMEAIGVLLAATSIDYDPGSIILPVLCSFSKNISPEDFQLYGSPLASRDKKDKKVFSFGYEDGNFYAQRDFYYPRFQKENLEAPADWSFIQTEKSVSPENPKEVRVTYKSSVFSELGVE